MSNKALKPLQYSEIVGDIPLNIQPNYNIAVGIFDGISTLTILFYLND